MQTAGCRGIKVTGLKETLETWDINLVKCSFLIDMSVRNFLSIKMDSREMGYSAGDIGEVSLDLLILQPFQL